MERKNWKFDIEINTNSEITLEKYCKQKILQHLLQQKPSLISSENYCKEKYESSKILRFDRLWKQWRCKIWPQNGRYQWYFICYRKLWYFYEIRDRVKILRFFFVWFLFSAYNMLHIPSLQGLTKRTNNLYKYKRNP